MKLSSPVVMAVSRTLAANCPHTIYDLLQLASPDREPLMIHEIRVHAGCVAFGGSNPASNWGPELRMTANAGPYLLCDDVPVWTLAPRIDGAIESKMGRYLGNFRWRFLRPMYLPPGMGFHISIRRYIGRTGSYTTANTVPIWVTVVGQVLEGDQPKTMVVPYASTFAPDAQISKIYKYVSTQQDLINTTKQTINLSYAVGRNLQMGNGFAAASDVVDPILYPMPCQLSHNTTRIIPQGTEFNAAFDYARRTLRLAGMELPAGDRLNFSMESPNVVGGDYYYRAPHVTIVGNRKEVVP